MKRREYNTYGEYVEHQKKARTTQRAISADDNKAHYDEFDEWFAVLKPHMELRGSRSVCLGPSFCIEVKYLRDKGSDCIGLDLVPEPPWSIEGDFHDMPFADGEFDLVYSNALDYMYDMEKFLAEVRRVAKVGGLVLFHLHLGQNESGGTSFESFRVDRPQEATGEWCEVLLSERLERASGRSKNMNWTLLLKRLK